MKYGIVFVVSIFIFGIVGCSQQTGSAQSTGLQHHNKVVVLRQQKQQGRGDSDLPATGQLVYLNSQDYEEKGILGQFVPAVENGIDYALQQGSYTSTQDIKKDGALTIDDTGQLALLIFLKDNSMIDLGDGQNFVKGDRDAGFLWSCVQSKLQALVKADPHLDTEQINNLIANFTVTYINTYGEKLSIAMPENTPVIKLDGLTLTDDDSSRARLIHYFQAKY